MIEHEYLACQFCKYYNDEQLCDLPGYSCTWIYYKEDELEESSTKPKAGKCPACGFEAPLCHEEEGQSVLICDNCEAGFPVYMYVAPKIATKTTKPEGEDII